MKLKLTTKPQAAAEGAPAAQPVNGDATPASAGPKLKFKIAPPSSDAVPAPATADPVSADLPKPKRKYTKKPKFDENGNAIVPAPKVAKPKKRVREEGEEPTRSAKRKPKPTAKSLEMIHTDDDLDEEDEIQAPPPVATTVQKPLPPIRAGSTIKLKMKGPQPTPQRTNTTLIKIKGVHGKPPPRPPGVGYDSEADEAEEDPAIESQFVLRMQPGPDCDALRKAIEDKTIGKSVSHGGPGVQFRFFDREGRRATVLVNGHLYAACMVDLPCVVESMKSWNKRDWVKSADVCQMLVVLGRVANEEEAKKYALPREINSSSHQFAHGLTPPMHYVRKRRFRPRVSYHRIEQVEAEVNSLLEADRRSSLSGGRAEFQVIDADRADSSGESSDQDGEGEDDDMVDAPGYVVETPGGEEVEVDNADLEQMLAAGFEEEDDDMGGLFGAQPGAGGEVEIEVETPATAHDVAMHAIGGEAIPTVESPAASPNAATSGDDDDDDDDDDADSGEEAVDADAAAELAGRETQLAEIQELEQEIEKAQSQYSTINNVLYKQRLKTKMDRLRTDLGLKKAALGIDDDGD